MKRFLHHLLALQVAACLCLAQQQVLMAPDLDASHEIFQQRREVVHHRGFVPQEEIVHPQDFMLQEEVLPELPIDHLQKEMELLPSFLQQEMVFSPRGRKPPPSASVARPRRAGGNLPDFPPGRPSSTNVKSICSPKRVRPNYGPHNLPQTGFTHQTRQGNAINSIEQGYNHCCTKGSQVTCAHGVWQNGLDQFCEAEFSVKTKPYPCCKRRDSERQNCFAQEAPNPNYNSAVSVSSAFSRSVQPEEQEKEEVPAETSPLSRKPCSIDQNPRCGNAGPDAASKLPKLSFPPAEPTDSCIQNICRLRNFRPVYTPDEIPTSGFGWMKRQSDAINRLENKYKKCCKPESVTCAHDAWVDVLSEFCVEELLVKTRYYECCTETEHDARFRCFASKAPHPNYDKEIGTIDLGTITESAMVVLCGTTKLISKQKQIPLLVKNLTEKCCAGTPEERLKCAEGQKQLYIADACSTRKDAWKDSEKCCSKESQERETCFNRSYLQSVSIASTSTSTSTSTTK